MRPGEDLPFWTSFLIRIYAWIAILKPAVVTAGVPAADLIQRRRRGKPRFKT